MGTSVRDRYDVIIKPLLDAKKRAGLPGVVKSWEAEMVNRRLRDIRQLADGEISKMDFDVKEVDLHRAALPRLVERRRARGKREVRDVETLSTPGGVRLV